MTEPSSRRPIFHSRAAEFALILALAAIAVLCTFVAFKARETAQDVKDNTAADLAQTTALVEEANIRSAANRIILRRGCRAINDLRRIQRAQAADAIRETRRFIRSGRMIQGITNQDLRRNIRQQKRFMRAMAPLNCTDFSDTLPENLRIPEGEDLLNPVAGELRRLRTRVQRIEQRLEEGAPSGGG